MPSAAAREGYAAYLEQARRFRKEFGHLRIPLRTDGRYRGLGKWAQKARLGQIPIWMRHELKRDLPDVLEERDDTPWVHLGARRRAWMAQYNRLVVFKKRFGHARVPRDWPEDRAHALWVYKQRGRARDGRMTPEEFRLLKRLGFEFDPRPGPDPLCPT